MASFHGLSYLYQCQLTPLCPAFPLKTKTLNNQMFSAVKPPLSFSRHDCTAFSKTHRLLLEWEQPKGKQNGLNLLDRKVSRTALQRVKSGSSDSGSGSGLLQQLSNAVNLIVNGPPEAKKDAIVVADEIIVGGAYAGDEDIRVLAHQKSEYNDIVVLDVARKADHPMAGSRVLLLDAPGNIHSIYNPFKVTSCFDSIYEPYNQKIWTDSYYDVFAALPPIVPEGPIALLGLAGGTAARLLLQIWPWLEVHGWELDSSVVSVAREYFDLSELEEREGERQGESDNLTEIEGKGDDCNLKGTLAQKSSSDPYSIPSPGLLSGRKYEKDFDKALSDFRTRRLQQGGFLVVHIGDAFSEEATIENGFSAILVDVFSDGVVVPQLQEEDTWRRLKARLRPGGRIMVNCAGACVESSDVNGKDGETLMRETVTALSSVFPNEVFCQRVDDEWGNVMALTGPSPNVRAWRRELPEALEMYTADWVPSNRFNS